MKNKVIILGVLIALIGIIIIMQHFIKIGPGSQAVLYEVGQTVSGNMGSVTLNEVEIFDSLDGYAGEDALDKKFIVCNVTIQANQQYVIDETQFAINHVAANIEASTLQNAGADYLSDYTLNAETLTFNIVFLLDDLTQNTQIKILFVNYIY
jgi:hypothetical protein